MNSLRVREIIASTYAYEICSAIGTIRKEPNCFVERKSDMSNLFFNLLFTLKLYYIQYYNYCWECFILGEYDPSEVSNKDISKMLITKIYQILFSIFREDTL